MRCSRPRWDRCSGVGDPGYTQSPRHHWRAAQKLRRIRVRVPAFPMPDPLPKAVFLSYARDDAAAARRIAEALRSSGLEVWFDENELRGGDTWDAKIRK